MTARSSSGAARQLSPSCSNRSVSGATIVGRGMRGWRTRRGSCSWRGGARAGFDSPDSSRRARRLRPRRDRSRSGRGRTPLRRGRSATASADRWPRTAPVPSSRVNGLRMSSMAAVASGPRRSPEYRASPESNRSADDEVMLPAAKTVVVEGFLWEVERSRSTASGAEFEPPVPGHRAGAVVELGVVQREWFGEPFAMTVARSWSRTRSIRTPTAV